MVDFPLWFPNTAARLRARQPVAMTWGAVLEFASETIVAWRGTGDLVAGGRVWRGLGGMGDVQNLEVSISGVPTEPVELVLSGLTARIAAKFADQSAELARRRGRVYVLTFDPSGPVLDEPRCVRSGVMDRARREMNQESGEFLIRLFLEPLTLRKHRPSNAQLTHQQQIRRYPGDNALERVARTAGEHTIEW